MTLALVEYRPMPKTKTRAQNRNAKRAAEYAAARGDANSPRPKPIADRERTGLEWLFHKKRISKRQADAGKRYGEDYRIAQVSGLSSLRSCLNDTPGGGEGIGLPQVIYEMEARDRLLAARQALAFQTDMIAACDLICGQQLTPWQVMGRTENGSARDVARLETSVTIALDLLAEHYRRA